MKAPNPPDFVDSDELREQRARSKARRLGYKVENDQGGYRLLRILPAEALIDDNLTLDQLEEWLDRFEDEDPVGLMKTIIAENPGASKQQIRRLLLGEVRAGKKLQETIVDEAVTKLFRDK
ncbi:MAG TPA: hypothetical protein VK749_12055 [Xanthobacteraceae bacterium]|jgi:hypothetical protein|nr:hypothetical protein [Xanthobacteraceae bacterium]